MALRLQIVSRHRQSFGEQSSKNFGHEGGTIGRSLENDWVLPDAQRYMSSKHASIDYRSGSYYIVDTSTNGVYVNGSETPVGRGTPQRLFSGDRIRMGEYEFSVEIEGEDDTRETLAKDDHVDPVVLAQRVPPPDPTRADLVQAHEITAVGIEMLLSEEAETSAIMKAAQLSAASLRLEDDPPPPKHEELRAVEAASPGAGAAAPSPPPRAQPKAPPPVSAAERVAPAAKPAAPPAAAAPPRAPAPPAPARSSAPAAARQPAAAPAAANGAAAAPRAAPPAPGAPSAALEAFFRGAGLPAPRLDDKDVEQILHRLGQVMREVIVGVNDNLHVRAEQKTALRVPNTTIQPRGNNPLKFSAGVEEAMSNLLFRESAEYVPAVDAVREVFLDIKLHQQSLLAALRGAILDYVGRLDPDELESKYGKRGGIMNAANKLKYWDLYKDLFQVVTQCAPGQLPQLLLEDLARAYEQESTRAGGAHARRPQAQAV
jgi:type VI secretion system FHA domain protein